MEETRDNLKDFFEKGDKPTEEQFADLIDSVVNKKDDQVIVRGQIPDVQIGLGAAPANLGSASNQDLVRLAIDQRLQTYKLQITENAADKQVLVSDPTGNALWTPQHLLDDGDWTVQYPGNTHSHMWAQPIGNVGIGTNTPEKKLDINGGDLRLRNNAGSANVIVENDRLGNYVKSSVVLKNSNSTDEFALMQQIEVQSPTGNLQVSNETLSLTKFHNDASGNYQGQSIFLNINPGWGNGKMFFNMKGFQASQGGDFVFQNGKVGIGETNPSHELDVKGSTQTELLQITALPTTSGNNILVEDGNGNVSKRTAQNLFSTGNGFGLWENDNGKIASGSGKDVKVRDKLTIGTNSNLSFGGHEVLRVEGDVQINEHGNSSLNTLKIYNQQGNSNSADYVQSNLVLQVKRGGDKPWFLGLNQRKGKTGNQFLLRRGTQSGGFVDYLDINEPDKKFTLKSDGNFEMLGGTGSSNGKEAKILLKPENWSPDGFSQLSFGDDNHYIRGQYGKGMSLRDTDGVKVNTPKFEVNGNSNFNGDVRVHGEKPFLFKRFRAWAENSDKFSAKFRQYTGIKVRDYPGATISGFQAVNFNGLGSDAADQDLIVKMEIHWNPAEGGYNEWKIVANTPNHLAFSINNREDYWDVWVVFVRKGLVEIDHGTWNKHDGV